MQTFSETSIAERFISRSSLIYVQEGDRHVKALKLKGGDQNTSRPNTVVSDLWKFELISKAWQSPRIWSCRCRACTWGSWRTHSRPPLSLAWTLTWNLAPPSPFPIVQVFQFLRSIFNPNYLSVSDHVCTTFGKRQVQLCSLLFFLRAPPYLTIGLICPHCAKFIPLHLFQLVGCKVMSPCKHFFIHIHIQLHTGRRLSSQPFAIHLHSLLFFVQRSRKIHNSCKM